MTGEELKNLRKGKGLTQEQLAEKVNSKFSGFGISLTKKEFSRWENGHNGISKQYQEMLRQVFTEL